VKSVKRFKDQNISNLSTQC